MRRAALALTCTLSCALFALPAAGPAEAADGNCSRDATVILSQVRIARQELVQASQGSTKERCAAWSAQVAALKRASAFYARCLTGAERQSNVANANAGISQYQSALNQQCADR